MSETKRKELCDSFGGIHVRRNSAYGQKGCDCIVLKADTGEHDIPLQRQYRHRHRRCLLGILHHLHNHWNDSMVRPPPFGR